MQRAKVLSLYRTILRGARKEFPNDRQYIEEEARMLFRRNRDLSKEDEIKEKIFEAESRIELAQHYKIPYSRLYNVPKGTEGNNESIRKNYIQGAHRSRFGVFFVFSL